VSHASSTGHRTCPVEQVAQTTKDVLFITIGFGVLTFQRVQVLRRELIHRLQTG
jgi:hypothetical protein